MISLFTMWKAPRPRYGSTLVRDSAFLEAFLMRGEIDFSEARVTTREEGLQYSSYPITLEWQDESYQGWWERRSDSAVLVRLERLLP